MRSRSRSLVDVEQSRRLAAFGGADFVRSGLTTPRADRTTAEIRRTSLLPQRAISPPAIATAERSAAALALADPAESIRMRACVEHDLDQGRRQRRVKAATSSRGYETDLNPGEILAAGRIPGLMREVFWLARRQATTERRNWAHRNDSGSRLAFAVGPTAILATHAPPRQRIRRRGTRAPHITLIRQPTLPSGVQERTSRASSFPGAPRTMETEETRR